MGQKDLDDRFFATVEVISLSVIIWLAWKWREYVDGERGRGFLAISNHRVEH